MVRKIAVPAGPSSARNRPSRRAVPTSHWPTSPPEPWALKSRVPVHEPRLELRQARPAEHEQRGPRQPPRMRTPGTKSFTAPNPSSSAATRNDAAPKKKKCSPPTIAPTGPMKLSRGSVAVAYWLKGTQAGRSLGW